MIHRRLIAALAVGLVLFAIPATAVAETQVVLQISVETNVETSELFSYSVTRTSPDEEGSIETDTVELAAGDLSRDWSLPGDYRIEQLLSADQIERGWRLETIDCGNVTVVVSRTGVELTMVPGNVAICVFTNSLDEPTTTPSGAPPTPSEAPPTPSEAPPTPSQPALSAPPSPSRSETAAASSAAAPREGTLGGNPVPGNGLLPDTATEEPSSPVAVIIFATLVCLGILLVTRRASPSPRR